MSALVKLTGIGKPRGSDEAWSSGEPVYVHPSHVIGIEPREHSYHSFRPKQTYSRVYLTSGDPIDVFMDSDAVREAIDNALGDEME
jgi:hypothetical protein